MKKKHTIMIVDDDTDLLEYYKSYLVNKYNVVLAKNAEQALEILNNNQVHIVFTDYKMPGMDGIELAKEIKRKNNKIIVILITSYGTIEIAVKSMKLGADDFIEKPVDKQIMKTMINNYIAKMEFKNFENIPESYFKKAFIGISEHIEEMHNMINTIAKIDTNVLITGETGTGKELVADLIIENSNRKNNPVAKINCAAIKKELIESELFGHEKGSFTGAHKTKKGYFEALDGGTLFLDEIGELDMNIQSKLLRVVENNEFMRVGSTKSIRTNVRLIFATNQKLKELVDKKQFRKDLFYRINKINIEIMPLRERKEDIPVLARYFINRYCYEHNIKFKQFSPEAINYMKTLKWEGNVRELKNCIERVIILTNDDIIKYDTIRKIYKGQEEPDVSTVNTLSELREKNEKLFIEKKLKNNNNNISKTAKLLRINRTTLYRKMKKLGIKKK